ncbi:MAG: hypothetical protein J0H09_19655 [Burkholderiales bacterium]|nr:hypothetical protein [Burkholderiales bacterium]
MSPTQRTQAFTARRNGVFYPTGHVVLAVMHEQLPALEQALQQAGFGTGQLMRLSPQETIELMDQSAKDAGLLSRIVSAELKETEVLRQLAQDGASLLIVRLGDDADQELLTQAVQGYHIRKASCYHTLAIEELAIGTEEIPQESPYGMNEIPRAKPSDAQLKPK